MKTRYLKAFFFLLLIGVFISCDEQPEMPSSIEIPAQESGLIGTWQGVEMVNEFAIPLLDENGEVVLNDKLEEMSTDTVVRYTANATENVWNEVLSFRSEAEKDTFDVFSEVAHIGMPDTMHAARNLDLLSGHWAVIETSDPQGRVDNVTSVMLFDPELPHNPNNSFALAVKEVTGEKLVLQYGYGESLNDTLVTKTYEKVN